jgi:predicted permease
MMAISMMTCLLAGVGPAIRASGPPRTHASSGARTLIVIEVALCTILLVGSGWFVRTLWNLRTLDAGFVRDQVLLATVGVPAGVQGPAATALFEDLRGRLASVPGVRSVGYSNWSLMIGDGIANDIDAEGHQPSKTENITATLLRISPGFFATLGTPLISGREFADRDEAGAPQVAIVNETFARHFYGDVNAIGKHFGERGPKSVYDYEIVGVVKDTKYANLREESRAIFYVPMRQTRVDLAMVIAVRSSGDLGTLANTIRDIVRETDPKVTKITRFSTLIDASLASERMVAQVSAAFGALALLVACIGIYGILAYRVARRTREIGVRIALGASRGSVQWMVTRESLALLVIGVAIGIPVALGLSRYVVSLLYGLAPTDPATMAATLGLLAIVSIAAAFLPARRAARIDPMAALRCE